MAIKASAGKLSWDVSLIDDLPNMEIELIIPDGDSLQNYAILNPSNKDPCDNMIASVARSNNSTLMTSDPKILSISIRGLSVIDASK